ncbi:MAG: prepilin-type N-terminal cleavage/methylation domain-containing protein [Candidatus Eisenbacteria bacterium]|nr:prepilin-type N-terminal cleavage/methylation domain-containing protein [Candidatus Eisenbacteria bacterium]
MNRANARGFSLIELMMVVTIAGILLRIALPAYSNLVRNARAAQAVGDFNTVRAAAFSYHTVTNAWPREYATGKTPPELVPYLPRGYTFVKSKYSLDWENWVLPRGTPRYPATQVMLGVSVSTTDAKLGNTVVSVLGKSAAHYTMNNSYTFVISSTLDGAP